MNLSHFELMLIFAVCISAIIAIITKEGARAQLKYFIIFLGILVGAALVIAWLMYPYPRG
ncbi:MAG: hypothetical protein A2Y62_07885 [Candidatus Fischerbacteria bacterium RBG_13_37_8]|uniref:Uncharacterized protein n=1 Tax=Candidatus Fischerbacteria bacterium RBG_13_37_8 TaxID=1817863 RepID=A0A1F5V929_9BACT|nr:MAG: hypothetical protein A2Y62_07885 [Candidatus Fischerbacteria bacterium RBG_13_37_8]